VPQATQQCAFQLLKTLVLESCSPQLSPFMPLVAYLAGGIGQQVQLRARAWKARITGALAAHSLLPLRACGRRSSTALLSTVSRIICACLGCLRWI
jgi:hypothetical protein